MNQQDASIPAVMVFSGVDPSGGAGLIADVEALASMGCHVAPLVTALTVQNTSDVFRYEPVDSMLLIEQARTVLEDIPIKAFKIGMLADTGTVEVLHTLLSDYPEIPLVYDPVLRAGGGGELSDSGVVDAISSLLLPQTTVLTPNSEEARQLAPQADTLDACAQELLSSGCEYVLITGTHEQTAQVENSLYGNFRRLDTWTWQRLPDSFHGSGCTLAAAITGLLAQGLEPFTAINEAQEYTWETLQNAYRIGMGQLIPNRMFWARDNQDGSD